MGRGRKCHELVENTGLEVTGPSESWPHPAAESRELFTLPCGSGTPSAFAHVQRGARAAWTASGSWQDLTDTPTDVVSGQLGPRCPRCGPCSQQCPSRPVAMPLTPAFRACGLGGTSLPHSSLWGSLPFGRRSVELELNATACPCFTWVWAGCPLVVHVGRICTARQCRCPTSGPTGGLHSVLWEAGMVMWLPAASEMGAEVVVVTQR